MEHTPTAQPVPMPKLGMTMTEGIIVAWHVTTGAEVAKDAVLAEVETDKVTLEVESPFAGRVAQLLAEEGATIPVGEPILMLVPLKAAARTIATLAEAPEPQALAHAAPPSLMPTPAAAPPSHVRVTPYARRLARELGVDVAAIAQPGVPVRAAAVLAAAPGLAPVVTAVPASQAPLPITSGDDILTELTTMRRIIAERTTQSFTTTPHIYLDTEVDMWRAEKLRLEMPLVKGKAPSVTALLVRAVALALRSHPQVNAAYVPGTGSTAARIRTTGGVHIAMATAVPDGLLTPVLRHADRRTITDIATEMAQLAELARSGKLAPDHLAGGTFSISNLGMYGIDTFHAIINQGQSAILAVGRVNRRPVAVPDGAGGETTAIRPILKLSLSADHRVVDGATGAQFLATLRALLETPDILAKEP